MIGLWLVALLWATPGDEVAADALRDGRLTLAEGRFEEALSRLDQGLEQAPSPGLGAALQLARAECFSALGLLPQRDEALKAALTLDPTVQMDPSRTVPPLLDRLEQLRKSLLGTLKV